MPTVANIESASTPSGTSPTPSPPANAATTTTNVPTTTDGRSRRTPTAVARQQAGWLVSSRVTNCLSADDVQLVRFVSLYESFVGTDSWWKRPEDLLAAASVAGVFEVENGWVLDENDAAPHPEYGHPTIGDALARRGHLLVSAWAWDSQHRLGFLDVPMAPPSVDLHNPFDVVAANMWRNSGPWAWAYWCCRILEGDDAASVSIRSVTLWAAAQSLGRRTPMTPAELLERHSRWAWWQRQPKLDPKYLAEAAKAAKIKLL